MVEESEIRQGLLKAFPDAQLHIVDTADDKQHYSVEISSQAFEGKNRVEQHRLVYQALGDKVGRELHALQLKTIVKGKK